MLGSRLLTLRVLRDSTKVFTAAVVGIQKSNCRVIVKDSLMAVDKRQHTIFGSSSFLT